MLIFESLKRPNVFSMTSIKDIKNKKFKMEKTLIFKSLKRANILLTVSMKAVLHKQIRRPWELLFTEVSDLMIILDEITSDLIQTLLGHPQQWV